MKHASGKDSQESKRLCLVTYERKDAKKFSRIHSSALSLRSLRLCGVIKTKHCKNRKDAENAEIAQRKLLNLAGHCSVCGKLLRGFKCCRAFVALADVGSKTISHSLSDCWIGVHCFYYLNSLHKRKSSSPTRCACSGQSRRLHSSCGFRFRHSPTRTIQSDCARQVWC